LFSTVVFRLDGWLRQSQGIFEYSSHPHCLFRIQIQRVRHNVSLADGTRLAAGDRIIALHLWNEQVPPFSKEALTLGWARRFSRVLAFSLGDLARYLEACPDLADIKAVGAKMALGPPEQTPQITRLVGRYGFEIASQSCPQSAIGRLLSIAENILITILVLARNPGTCGWDDLRRDRVEVFISRSTLECRHGATNSESAVATRSRG
jgi:hypothetical protein